MKGYSKMKLTDNNNRSKSRSIDFSDQTNPTTQIQKPTTKQQPKIPDYDDDDYKYYSSSHEQQSAASFGGTTNDARFKIEKQNSTGRNLQTAVKRVMSIRRSTSVSESYSRIHDHYANPFDDYEEHEYESKNNMKKRNRGSILKVCKRIFGI